MPKYLLVEAAFTGSLPQDDQEVEINVHSQVIEADTLEAAQEHADALMENAQGAFIMNPGIAKHPVTAYTNWTWDLVAI